MRQSISLVATVEREYRRFGSGDDSVVVLHGKSHDADGIHAKVVLKGPVSGSDPATALTYRFYGRWTEYCGTPQFAYDSMVKYAAHGRAGITRYLEINTKIGRYVAGLIYSEFGENSVKLLRETPDVVADAVPRLKLSREAARVASAALQEASVNEDAVIAVAEMLSGRGFPGKMFAKVVEKFGGNAVEKIEKDPYILMQIPGCGFKRADALYLDLGNPPDSIKRQVMCTEHALRLGNGSTWLFERQIEKVLENSIGGASINHEASRAQALKENRMRCIRTDGANGPIDENGSAMWMAHPSCADDEQYVADAIFESILEKEYDCWPTANLDQLANRLHPHQLEALKKACQTPISILCGGPGTGKTTIIAAYLKQLIQVFGHNSVVLAAPTGKAARRLTQAMEDNGIHKTASTIHRLLGVESVVDDNWKFTFNEQDKLPYKVIIIDEVSMCDIGLMASVLRARAPGTLMMLVGDIGQLAPVGNGAPLRDLMKSRIACGELTEIVRNDGQIVLACKDIREGRQFSVGGNLVYIEASTPEEQIDAVRETIASVSEELQIDPLWDIQVVVATNIKGHTPRKLMNGLLQEYMNSHEEKSKNAFRVGDKVVNTKNTTFILATEETDKEGVVRWKATSQKTYIANGEFGEVVSVGERSMAVRGKNSDRVVISGFFADKEEESGNEEDGSSTNSLWDLAYSISCHKSQGSEWPVVIVMLDSSPSAMTVCSREWIYTAISRAKDRCYLVGNLMTAQVYARKPCIAERKTFLAELIEAKFEKKRQGS